VPADLVIAELASYPVKSCRAVPLTEAVVEARGFRDDRLWMTTDEAGMFQTQRTLPQLARITASIDADVLHLAQDGLEPLAVRVPTGDDASSARHTTVRVWKDDCAAWDAGDAAAAWLEAATGTRLRLVRIDDDHHRRLDPRWVADDEPQTGFADGYPFLLTTTASLADLNARLDEPVPMARFRPNIVVDGDLAAFAEDHWRRLRIGEVEFDVAKPCGRCVVITTDQASGERAREPLRTLTSYRRQDVGVVFGQNLVHRGRGTIRIGDPVTVLD
jgi:uncharacterized protein YcbX